MTTKQAISKLCDCCDDIMRILHFLCEMLKDKTGETDDDTRISVYENLWNILKESMKAQSSNWMQGLEIFMDMEKMERIQKGIPEEDEEE